MSQTEENGERKKKSTLIGDRRCFRLSGNTLVPDWVSPEILYGGRSGPCLLCCFFPVAVAVVYRRLLCLSNHLPNHLCIYPSSIFSSSGSKLVLIIISRPRGVKAVFLAGWTFSLHHPQAYCSWELLLTELLSFLDTFHKAAPIRSRSDRNCCLLC